MVSRLLSQLALPMVATVLEMRDPEYFTPLVSQGLLFPLTTISAACVPNTPLQRQLLVARHTALSKVALLQLALVD